MSFMKKIILLPVYLLSVFTQVKSFKSNPVIGSKILNILGLHVFRLVVSHAVFKVKLLLLAPLVGREDYRNFCNDGYLLKEDFLPKNEFDSVRSEALGWNESIRQNIQGNTLVYRSFLNHGCVNNSHPFRRLIEGKALLKLLRFASGKNERPRFYIEQVRHDEGRSGKDDPQKNLHSDTFHPTMKAWIFLDDVSLENGPFNYVKGSNKLTWQRLKWEYKKSISAKDNPDGYSEKGSFRLYPQDVKDMDLPEATAFCVKKNSLLIANTHGFHCRGEALRKGAKRLTIWVSSRVNPFSPWIGFNSKILSNIRDDLLVKYQHHLDKVAAAKGGKSSWCFAKDGARYDK